MWSLSTLDATGKWLIGAGIPLITVVWMRYLSHLVLMSCLVIPKWGLGILRSKSSRFQYLRAVTMLAASFCLFAALRYLPQAQSTAIAFMAPLIMLAIAPWFLGEPKRLSRWIAAGIGFLGVLIVVRPGAGLDPIGVMFAFGAALFLAFQHITTRKLAVDNPMTTLLWGGWVGTALSSVLMFLDLENQIDILSKLSVFEWVVMISLGLTGGIGHLMQIQAYRQAPASLLAPLIYLQITSAAAMGWIIWGDFPDRLTWIGIAVICSSGAGITIFEWQQKKRSQVS